MGTAEGWDTEIKKKSYLTKAPSENQQVVFEYILLKFLGILCR